MGRAEENKGGKWDNCNSIINEIYFLKRTIYRETTIEWMKSRIKSMIWNIKQQKSNQNNNKKRKSKKNDSISSLWDNFKRSNICIIEVPEEEEKEQEIGNLFEKIMKENFLNLVKEIDMQVQKAES